MVSTAAGPSKAQVMTDGPRTAWAWHPPLPLQEIPVFVWPPRPLAAARFFLSRAFVATVVIPFVPLSIITWVYLQPALERCAEFRFDWIFEMYARNLGLLILVAGGLHLFLYTFKRQGSERKYDPHDPAKSNRKFFTGRQVWDNVFWSCASGVTLWTAYEVFFMWAYANDLLPVFLDWTQHPVWFAFMFVAIPFWGSLHFYFIHRLLHWGPLYRVAHSVHHRNENVGPWSGNSMHPIEHIIYFSSVLIHAVVLSHPVHVIFHLQWNIFGGATTHSGFDSLTYKGKPIFELGSFHHQLHHRYHTCNYGNRFMPWDEWFGTNHDGTPESLARIRERQRSRLKAAT